MEKAVHRLVKSSLATAVAVMVLSAASSAFAQNAPQLIDVYSKWEAYTYTEKGKKVCYMGSQPTSAKGDYSKRGKIYVMVTHRPALKLFNEVSFIAGYTYKKNSEVDVRIDSNRFKLFTYNDSAWAVNSEEDRKLVKAMKAGMKLVVVGHSRFDTKTTDTYSLSGFTDAYNAISKACNARKVD